MAKITLTLNETLSKALRAEAESDGGRTYGSVVTAALMARYGISKIPNPKGRPRKSKKEAAR